MDADDTEYSDDDEYTEVADEFVEISDEFVEPNNDSTISVNPLELVVLSPERACEHYTKVKLNTMMNIICKINRFLCRSVADSETIDIEKAKILPDPEIDTLCVMNDNIENEILELYRSKGWNVSIQVDPDGLHQLPDVTTYKFTPLT